ncbi:MAG: Stf0 family sulfotransferase [Cypionkella sp.]
MTGYILCTSPRSGSTLLCRLLRSSGVAGWPESWFRAEDMADYAQDWGIAGADGQYDWSDYLTAAIRAGQAGTPVMGLRLMWPTMMQVTARLNRPLTKAFGPLRYIHLERCDRVAQAVSRLKAVVSGTWHLGFEEAEFPRLVSYDFDRIKTFRDEATSDNAQWRQWFAQNGIVPLHLTYEALAADPVAVAAQVLDFVGVSLPRGHGLQTSTTRMADAVSADWAARFRREEAGAGQGAD